MDYAIVLAGEIDLELDSGEVIHLKSGDVVVQRGTMHTWVNRASVPAVTAFILIDAKPVEVNGEELCTVFSIQRKEDKTKRENSAAHEKPHSARC
jgi:quercetin dioxygenase-like cupin family protein